MICYKFDKENVDMSIKVFRDFNKGRNPYLICNNKTVDLLLKNNNSVKKTSENIYCTSSVIATSETQAPIKSIKINDKEFVEKESYKQEHYKYNDCIVYIDDSLEFGELRLA